MVLFHWHNSLTIFIFAGQKKVICRPGYRSLLQKEWYSVLNIQHPQVDQISIGDDQIVNMELFVAFLIC